MWDGVALVPGSHLQTRCALTAKHDLSVAHGGKLKTLLELMDDHFKKLSKTTVPRTDETVGKAVQTRQFLFSFQQSIVLCRTR
jgi:hypothetical protein